jgi:hypothetical protein
MPVYHVTIGGHTFEVESPTELSDAEAHQHVLDSDAMGSSVGRFASGLWDSTVGGIKGMFSAAMDAPSPTPDSVAATLLKKFLGGQVDEGRKAVDNVRQGRYSEAAGHGAAALLPVFGPAAAHAGERIGEGDVAGGLGEATGLLAPGAMSEAGPAVGAVGRGMERVGNMGKGKTLTPASVSAAMGHPALAAAEMIVPPALRVAGRGLQRVGGAMDAGRDALTSGIQKTADDVGSAVSSVPNMFDRPMTPAVEGSMMRAHGRQLVRDGMASPEDAAGIAGQDPFAYGKSTSISHNDMPTFNVNEGVRNVRDMTDSGFSQDAAVNVEAGGGKYGQSAADVLRKMLKVREDVQAPPAMPNAAPVSAPPTPLSPEVLGRPMSFNELVSHGHADNVDLNPMDAPAERLATMKNVTPDVPPSMQSMQSILDGDDPIATRHRDVVSGKLKYDPIADNYVPPDELSSFGRDVDTQARSISLEPQSFSSLRDMILGNDADWSSGASTGTKEADAAKYFHRLQGGNDARLKYLWERDQ